MAKADTGNDALTNQKQVNSRNPTRPRSFAATIAPPRATDGGARNVGEASSSDPLERWRWEPSTAQLPVGLTDVNQPRSVRFLLSDDLRRWGDAGRVHEVLLR